jgi:alkanesulfonate monooxygenase SsuD/methylene tetrahydromethanopterin reductase-like flavin-dependent oxidoreductase (luciferase family)
MRFSLFYNFDILPGKAVAELYQEIEEQALAADRLGFDAIWLAEHHFEIYGRMPAPLLHLARISGITRQIALGTAIVEAPYYHPLRLAEDSALLDVLSNGRLCLGIGSGAGNKPGEFARFSIPIKEKTARTLETVEILRQAFDNGVVDFTGEHFSYQQVEINPRPLQSAQQIIWLAASNATPEVAGKGGYGLLIPRIGTVERHLHLINRYRAALDGKAGRISQLRFVYVAETAQTAREQTRRTVERYAKYELGITWDGRTDSEEYLYLLKRLNAVIGTPEQIIEQLSIWQQESGFDEIMCQVYAAGMPHADSLRSLELLGQGVLPHLQTHSATLTTRE